MQLNLQSGTHLIKDGLVGADEGPLVHRLLSVSQGHRVADVEQLETRLGLLKMELSHSLLPYTGT